MKYTVEFEDDKHSQNFLDINITNNTNNKKYEFKVHRKDAIKVKVKPKVSLKVSYIEPTQCVQKNTSKKKHSS